MNMTVLRTVSANSGWRWLWYTLIGIGLVFAILSGGESFPAIFDQRYAKWGQFAILTVGLFGYLLNWGWRYRRRVRFWRFYFLLFIGHCAIFIPVFSYGRWPIPLLALLGSLEIMGLATLIALMMGEKLRRR